MKLAFIITGICLLIFSIIFIFGPSIKRFYCYKKHKKRTAKILYSLAKNYDNFLINNFMIKKNDEVIDFDQVYFGSKYIYCIKTLTFPYGIEGSQKDAKWFSYNQKKGYDYINNPLIENEIKVKSLKKHLGVSDDEQFIFSIICINDSCDIEISDMKEDETCINLKKLKKFILSKEKDKSVGIINQKLLENTVKVLYKQCQQVDNP